MKRVILLLAVLGMMAGKAWADDRADAKRICQFFAYKQLKASSTAVFEPLDTVAAIQVNDNKWKELTEVWQSTGWVDTRNGSKIKIRSEYMCTVRKISSNNWKLLEMYWQK
jgi:hypothetical protein